MKPYFVKWLPVPEPAAVGDVYLCENEHRVCTSAEHGLIFYGPQGIYADDPKDCQKLMLHLCRYGVPSIGDKLTCLVANYLGVELVVTETWLSAMGTVWVRCVDSVFQGQALQMPNQAVKVSGLISTGATWVKDGDELEEADVSLGIYSALIRGRVPYGSKYDHWLEDAANQCHVEARIKCLLCGTFH